MTDGEYKKIYELLDTVNPVPFDCGGICGAVCCRQAEEEMGIFLLPGEEKIHDASEWESAEQTDGHWFVKCRGPERCDRRLRPIQCRTFPLFPEIDEDGRLKMSFNPMELPYSCPLIEADARLDPEFIRVTERAWQKLLQDPEIFEWITSKYKK